MISRCQLQPHKNFQKKIDRPIHSSIILYTFINNITTSMKGTYSRAFQKIVLLMPGNNQGTVFGK